MSAIIKRKRISKKNKSAWRKTDIRDVEEFLEAQRQDERVGSFADAKNEELFTVDATPQKGRRPLALTEKQKRKQNAQKPFRSWAALENTSKVQDPIVKRNHVKQKKSGRIIEEEVRNPTKARHFTANKDRQRYYDQLDQRANAKSQRHLRSAKDIWVEKDFRDDYPGLKDEKGWISRDLAIYQVRNLGHPVVKVHDSIRHRTTKAKKFEMPHPGTSYNPSRADHLQLINKVCQREEGIIKNEQHLKRVTTLMFSKVTPEERDRQRFREMSSGLHDGSDEENDKSDDDNADDDDVTLDKPEKHGVKLAKEVAEEELDDAAAPYKTINPPVENKKKTRQARNREERQRLLQQKTLAKKALKKQTADLHRLKSFKEEILAEEEVLNDLKKRRKKTALKKKFEPKRLGKLKYVEPETDINMPEDVAGNLRNVKTESSLLVDRFKNFQKRNILPTSVATGKQKAKKIKRFPRNSHKDPGVSYQMLRERRKAATATIKV